MRLSVIITVLAIVILGGATLGYRLGILQILQAFGGIGIGVMVAGAASLLALITFLWTILSSDKTGLILSTLTLAAALFVFGIPAYQFALGMIANYPPIHDITTDLEDPPSFVDVLEARGTESNSVDYATKKVPENGRFGDFGGRSYKSIQQEHYPNIDTVIIEMAPDEVYWQALEVAIGKGWEIAAQVPEEGRIEATATTKWMGFKDDVVIRLRPANEDGTRTEVDVRSCSRVGGGDVGANARRIKGFLKELKSKTPKS